MLRLAKKDIKTVISNSGEIDCLEWKGAQFEWKENIKNVDHYVAKGLFILAPKQRVYEDLIISADYINDVFYLKTGYGKPIKVIDLLGIQS